MTTKIKAKEREKGFGGVKEREEEEGTRGLGDFFFQQGPSFPLNSPQSSPTRWEKKKSVPLQLVGAAQAYRALSGGARSEKGWEKNGKGGVGSAETE